MRWSNVIAAFLLLAAITICLKIDAQEPTKTIEVHVKRFAFSPAEITVKKGETVDLRLVSEDVTHSLAIKDLSINREVSKGHPVDIIITPQATGDLRGKCGRFCGSGHGTMTFTIHVKD
jgi:cytochrome c oxidase subunit II